MRDRSKRRDYKKTEKSEECFNDPECGKASYGLVCVVAPWKLIWNDRMGRGTVSSWAAHMSPSLAFFWDPLAKTIFKIRYGRSHEEACR